jgi:hypothetical protein
MAIPINPILIGDPSSEPTRRLDRRPPAAHSLRIMHSAPFHTRVRRCVASPLVVQLIEISEKL